MSMIEVTQDVKNNLLSRREITCTIKGLSGKLKKIEAIDMVTKEFKLDGKVIVPIKLKNETGRPMISATFYVYDDEKLAKQHVKPAIFTRLDKAKTGGEKKEEKAAPEKKEEKPVKAEDKKTEEKPAKKEEKKAEESKSAKKEEKKETK